MTWLTLSHIAEMTGGTLHGDNVAVKSVSTDSRNTANDQLFIAIKGERFDAHDFVADLAGKAGGALVHRLTDNGLPQVLVDDTHKALGDLAAAWRKQLSIPMIGLTGSNGKTTVKEMLSSILSEQGNVLATFGNLNNDIGMPLTLLEIRKEHDYAVIEMGANHFGEIDYLTKITRPDVAIINNAGAAHLEGFGDVDGVSRAKGEIFTGLPESGTAVINADDTYAAYWKTLCSDKLTTSFGMKNDAEIQGEIDKKGRLVISLKREKIKVNLKLLGDHNALNALAATAAATVVGATADSIRNGLEKLQPVKGRLAPVDAVRGAYLIDDTYNANPTSLLVGINVLMKRQGKKVLVLGDMGELGGNTEQMHYTIGKSAKEAGIDQLFCLGKQGQHVCAAFGEGAISFIKLDDLITTLNPVIQKNTSILIKGSRAMKMEQVVDAFSIKGEGTEC